MLENILSIDVIREESEGLVLLRSGIGHFEETVSGECRVSSPGVDCRARESQQPDQKRKSISRRSKVVEASRKLGREARE